MWVIVSHQERRLQCCHPRSTAQGQPYSPADGVGVPSSDCVGHQIHTLANKANVLRQQGVQVTSGPASLTMAHEFQTQITLCLRTKEAVEILLPKVRVSRFNGLVTARDGCMMYDVYYGTMVLPQKTSPLSISALHDSHAPCIWLLFCLWPRDDIGSDAKNGRGNGDV